MKFDIKTLSFIRPNNRSSGGSYKRYPIWPVSFHFARARDTKAWPWLRRGWVETGNDGFEKLIYQTIVGIKRLRISFGPKRK
jgi:hypothetical protein